MPIVVEVVVLALLAYLIGLAFGWALWGRAGQSEGEENQ